MAEEGHEPHVDAGQQDEGDDSEDGTEDQGGQRAGKDLDAVAHEYISDGGPNSPYLGGYGHSAIGTVWPRRGWVQSSRYFKVPSVM